MPAPTPCPVRECWEALFADAVPAEQRDHFQRHLESCRACQDRLDRGEGLDAGLLGLVRSFGGGADDDTTLQSMLTRLRDDQPRQPAELYFLRATETPGVLGMLGEFAVRRVIGQGGMGVVLQADEPALHRVVAIKVLSPALAGSPTARLRFQREAQAAARVMHEHVVAVHGVHETEALPYLVMQYIAGESLQDRLDRLGPLPVEEIVQIGLQTAQGLAAAHAQGLIHRDIKPANLLLQKSEGIKTDAGDGLSDLRAATTDVCVKITDFGLARAVDDASLTQPGVAAGTPEYMAPEQARGEPVDHRADLFSLGSVLYACCTGAPPFRGSGSLAVLRQVSDQTPRPVREVNPHVPAWLQALIARLMAREPADRIQTAAEAAELLAGCLAHLRQPASVPPPLPSSPGGRPTRAAGWFRLHFWTVVLLFPAFLAPAAWFAAAVDSPAESSQEYHRSLKG